MPSKFRFFIIFSFFIQFSNSLMCMQCGGEYYEGNVSLTKDKCCNSQPIQCDKGQICLRAWVFSPYGNFFLSGCHPDENSRDGCEFHILPHNSTVERCICRDDECQNSFPGDCQMNEKIGDIVTTTPRPLRISSPPSLSARLSHISSDSPTKSTHFNITAKISTATNKLNRGRAHHSHRVNVSPKIPIFPIFFTFFLSFLFF